MQKYLLFPDGLVSVLCDKKLPCRAGSRRFCETVMGSYIPNINYIFQKKILQFPCFFTAATSILINENI